MSHLSRSIHNFADLVLYRAELCRKDCVILASWLPLAVGARYTKPFRQNLALESSISDESLLTLLIYLSPSSFLSFSPDL